MMSLMMIFSLISSIMMILTLILNMISKKSFNDREKSSPFECGFDAKSHTRLPFSLHFFLIAIIFLIFDIEITLMLPLVYSMKISNLMTYTISVSMFISILLYGLYHEWKQGALNWVS